MDKKELQKNLKKFGFKFYTNNKNIMYKKMKEFDYSYKEYDDRHIDIIFPSNDEYCYTYYMYADNLTDNTSVELENETFDTEEDLLDYIGSLVDNVVII